MVQQVPRVPGELFSTERFYLVQINLNEGKSLSGHIQSNKNNPHSNLLGLTEPAKRTRRGDFVLIFLLCTLSPCFSMLSSLMRRLLSVPFVFILKYAIINISISASGNVRIATPTEAKTHNGKLYT